MGGCARFACKKIGFTLFMFDSHASYIFCKNRSVGQVLLGPPTVVKKGTFCIYANSQLDSNIVLRFGKLDTYIRYSVNIKSDVL